MPDNKETGSWKFFNGLFCVAYRNADEWSCEYKHEVANTNAATEGLVLTGSGIGFVILYLTLLCTRCRERLRDGLHRGIRGGAGGGHGKD